MPTSPAVEDEPHEPQHARPRSGGGWRLAAWLGLVPVGIAVLVVIGWAIDASALAGQVVRNVELAGTDVGGLEEEELPEVVAEVAREFRDRPVRIETSDTTYETTAAEIGLAINEEATAEAVLDVGRRESFLVRPWRWVMGFLGDRSAPLRFTVSATNVREELARLQGDARTPPVEPTVEYQGDGFVAVPGRSGEGLDPAVVEPLLVEAANEADGDAIVIEVEPGEIPPRFADSVAEDLAAEAAGLTDDTVTVEAGGRSAEIPLEVLRGWVTAVPGDDALELRLARTEVLADLPGIIGAYDDGPRDARFVVEGNVPRLIASEAGTVCCTPDSPRRIFSALRRGTESVELEIAVREPEFTTEEAEELGITEEIGAPAEFGPTTEHACCESRVTNIHRIADIIRGVVIKPGETFSVNAYVGQRTRDKGFVSGGAIVNGVVDEQIGGGVSQFATTFFNAALFAGLEFGEYQSHSLYISRYPRGHEATISWQHPDLQIKNPTPYGVLVWPTYTETSITVHLYSTTYYQSVQVGEPTSSPSGRCTRWTTPRTRVLSDGRTLRDSVHARYRPAEGVNC